jgi:large subunit ribosomal protein L4
MAAKLEEKVFDVPVRTDLLHAVAVSQLAGRRRGTAATKNRALVSGGGRKPYRQKGTGRARHGSTRVNIWAGGGVVFGPQPRSFEQRLPKKVRRAALRSALSLKKRDGLLAVVDSFEVPEIKTKRVVERLKELDAEDALIVTAERDRTLERAARNLPRVQVLPAAALNVRGVLARKHLIMTEAAVRAVVDRLG